ncbi:aromatic acid exporter family protein, partial [Streptomyces sp. NPDC029704]|uniref:FUSC family protein n=1 Tax=Streptomyces sp. NPDC029704 TaxID=3156920 RepID=UPI0033E667DB
RAAGVRCVLARSWSYLLRAARRPGPERNDVLLQLKAVAATVAAWYLAGRLLPAQVRAFAPFTALLALQRTVYRSLWEALRYLGALVIGAGVTGVLGTTAGVHAWTLALVMLLALVAAKTSSLGGQRYQIPVVAAFVFTSGLGRWSYITHMVAAVALGVGCGLVAHFLPAPSSHPASARQQVDDVWQDTRRLVKDMAHALGDGRCEGDCVQMWGRSCRRIGARAGATRATVRGEEENRRLNPRSRRGEEPAGLDTCLRSLDVLDRVVAHLHSLLRGLRQAAACTDRPSQDFLAAYAGLLHRIADALAHHCPGRSGPDDAARRATQEARGHCEELIARYPQHAATDRWHVYGTLLIDASRILHDLEEPEDVHG